MVHDTFPGLPAGQELERGPQVVELPARTAPLTQTRPTHVVVEEAVEVARELRKIVDQRGWAQKYGQGEHLTIEAWTFIGRWFSTTARIVSTEHIEIGGDHGFKAVAEAVCGGEPIGRAEALCMTDEPRWRDRPKYEWQGPPNNRRKACVGTEPVSHRERLGMAQTRACSRVLASIFKPVAGMAGYQGTPTDDLPESEPPSQYDAPPEPRRQNPQPQARSEDSAAEPRISKEQARDLRAMATEMHGEAAQKVVSEILGRLGYRVSSEVRVSDLKAVTEAIEATRK